MFNKPQHLKPLSLIDIIVITQPLSQLHVYFVAALHPIESVDSLGPNSTAEQILLLACTYCASKITHFHAHQRHRHNCQTAVPPLHKWGRLELHHWQRGHRLLTLESCSEQAVAIVNLSPIAINIIIKNRHRWMINLSD